MFQLDWLKSLAQLRFGFWLSLPLIGCAFWLITGWLTTPILSQTYKTQVQLQANNHPKTQLSISTTILSIEADIDQQDQVTEVTVRTADTALKEMEFEFSVTDYIQVEAAIAQELKLSPSSIRPLMRYRLE